MKNLCFTVLLLACAAFAQEDALIAVLKSDAPLKDKADACEELARIGTRQAVPALAPLLANEQLSHMARFALEPIADPSVDEALRDALGKVKGRSLVGVISSLGVRKDAAAVEPLARFLADADPDVAQAAARALGRIGGAAVPALKSALAANSGPARLAVCEGVLRCAEALSGADAAALYDGVRTQPDLPHQLRVAALRGAILSRGAKGLPLLVEALRTEVSVPAADAIRISTELPGAEVTQALAGELARAKEEKQILLLQALGCRGDATAAPALVPLARSGSVDLRIAALRSLVQLADQATLPVLAELVKDPNGDISSAALAGLIGFPRLEADVELVRLLKEADPKIRVAVIDAIGQRRVDWAVPVLLNQAGDADAGVANASLKVLGGLAGKADLVGVVHILLQGKTVAAAEAALSAICSREPDRALCTQALVPALAQVQGEPKLALLRVLGVIGNDQALAAVRSAAADADAAVKETAVRVLCDWPTMAVLPDLAEIARTSENEKFRVLAQRGQLRLAPKEAAFTPLFNGKDLTGWEGKPGWWKVEDGALTAESTPEKPCKACNYLIWRGGKPADFELLADFKLSGSANSGIQLRSEERPDWDTFGYQADMTGDGKLVGFVYHHARGLIAGRGEKAVFDANGKKTVEALGDPADLLKHFKPGDWNTYRVICHGSDITLYVNGVLMCQISDHHATQAAARGIIALQMHPGPPMKIQFRKILLRELAPAVGAAQR